MFKPDSLRGYTFKDSNKTYKKEVKSVPTDSKEESKKKETAT